MRLTIFCSLASSFVAPVARAQDPGVPVFDITPLGSTVQFDVEASLAIKSKFDKWDASLTFASTDLDTCVVDIEIQAASVDTGSGMKDGKLKGKDFFDLEHNPLITFHSTKIVQSGPNTFDVDGDFTIRGVTKPAKLSLTVSGGEGTENTISGTMAFDRKQYGMNSGIPFINLKAKRVSAPPVTVNRLLGFVSFIAV
jgi:polyisoprenoid-binding protein YceI